MDKMLKLGQIYKVGNKRWKIGAIMNPGERYYLLVNPKDQNDVGFFPASWIENSIRAAEKRAKEDR
jgi:hypothetical protein